MSYVYWIRSVEHTDKLTEGYIGVTEDTTRRFSTHKRRHRVPEDSILEIVFEGTRDDCFALELELRPQPKIGWNNAAGGAHGWKIGFEHSKETKQRLKDAWTEERRIAASRPRPDLSEILKGQKRPSQSEAMVGENNPMYGTVRPQYVRDAVSKSRKGIPSANRIELYCIGCHEKVNPTHLKKYHGKCFKNQQLKELQ